MAKITLHNRKRTGEMSVAVEQHNQSKKDELLALKMKSLNDLAVKHSKLLELPLHLIHPDPNQPRKVFKNIESLAKSIVEKGVLQPIIVKTRGEGHYQIIVGERRFRAAELAGRKTIPAILREEEDADTLILQLLENDQRERVSPLEEAEALQKLVASMGWPKQKIAAELGRDSAWISLRLGLLNVSNEIKDLITTEKILDLRTLHELRMLSKQDIPLFKKVLHKIHDLEPTGGYRHLIRSARKSQTEETLAKVLKADYCGGVLFLHLEGKRKPLQLIMDSSLLKSLKLTAV